MKDRRIIICMVCGLQAVSALDNAITMFSHYRAVASERNWLMIEMNKKMFVCCSNCNKESIHKGELKEEYRKVMVEDIPLKIHFQSDKEKIQINNILINIMRKNDKKVEDLNSKTRELKMMLERPCQVCPYDGAYRCETCKENNYAGFNVKDYPKV